jgi:hypothetical protein
VEGNPVNYQDPAGNYKSPYSKAGIPCPIPGTGGWIQIGCGNPLGSSSPGPKSSNIRTVEYDRAAAVRYAYSHDWNDSVENGIYDWTPLDCANFVSLALWAGGVRDTRADPYILNRGGVDYDIKYWHKWKAEKKNVVYGDFDEFSWYNVNGLFDFLTKVLLFRSYEKVGDIPWFHKGVSSESDQKAWLDFLTHTPIKPGDVVQYKVGSDWVHTALIVDTSDSQTFYETDHDKNEYLPDNCDVFPYKPRIVDRDGPIDYKISRSIDNTGSEISAIRIIHIPDILKVRYVK